jgi:hypothetical protein
VDALNKEFLAKIVPMVVPRMISFGLMILGKAGIGKTPVAQILCMAIARHIIDNRSLEALPGIRKARQIDGFRERPGEAHVPVILDDPNLSAINLEDLKSFLDVGENSLVDARYRAAKFMRNQARIILNNEWDDTKEPKDAILNTITWEDFKGMFLTACQHPKVPHLMAILKRTSVIIAGHHGVYVRLPSEHSTEPIHRFANGGITEDWLVEKNKHFYGLYKQGVHQKYMLPLRQTWLRSKNWSHIYWAPLNGRSTSVGQTNATCGVPSGVVNPRKQLPHLLRRCTRSPKRLRRYSPPPLHIQLRRPV